MYLEGKSNGGNGGKSNRIIHLNIFAVGGDTPGGRNCSVPNCDVSTISTVTVLNWSPNALREVLRGRLRSKPRGQRPN